MQENDFQHVRTFHSRDGLELHFRFIGETEERAFVVNVQMPVRDIATGAWLSPDAYDFGITKILEPIIGRICAGSEILH